MTIGKEMKINRDNKGKFAKSKPWKVIFYIWLIAGLLAMVAYGLEKYADYRAEYDWVWKFPVEVNTYKILTIEKTQPVELISPVVIEQIEESDIEIENPVDQKIYDLWGDRYFLLARSIFKCESGLREDAVNWNSQDIGVAQINWPTWEKQVYDKFGYTLKDMFDYDKNLEVAHWIWDRDGDGQGSFAPWVVYQNGNFIGCVE